jgi:hypothetical protein
MTEIQTQEKAVFKDVVYVRKVAVKDLPDDVKAEAGALKSLYAVHRTDGEQVALVADRKMAFILARQHDLTPVSVH